MLKFGYARAYENVAEQADSVMAELGLKHCANARIGGLLRRGLSGGERKRVSVAIELCKEQSSVLLLDEPTSGLDSSTAYQTLLTLRRLCTDHNRTVICTIHQPHSNIYKLFDNIMLLSKGRCIYNGPAESALDYFADLGYPSEAHTNPADHMLDLISIDARSPDVEELSKKRMLALHAAYLHSSMCRDSHTIAKKVVENYDLSAHSLFSTGKRIATMKYFMTYHSLEWRRFLVLVSRNFTEMFRDTLPLMLRFAAVVVMSVVLGLFFWQLGTDQHSVFDRQGSLFFITVQQAATPIVITLTAFQLEKRLFQREHNQGLFSAFTYYSAKVLCEVPLLILSPIIAVSIAYPMTGLQSEGHHLSIAMLSLITGSFAAQAMGLLISNWSPNLHVANIVMPMVLSFMLLFSGLFVNSSSVPVFFGWIEYVNFMKFTFEMVAFTDLNDLKFTCDGGTFPSDKCQINDGSQILQSMSMGDVSIADNIGYIVALTILFHLLAFVGLKLTKPTHT
jgi:ATP-binding cassette subfamily G (WHITE) protein 2